MLEGGTGLDVISFANATQDVVYDLSGGSDVEGADTISGVEAIWGGAGHDSLTGDAGDNTFRGGAGNDTFRGGAGRDLVDYSQATSRARAFLEAAGSTGYEDNGGQGMDVIGKQMGIALIATFYGILLANLICKPIAIKLERRTEQRLVLMNMVLQGISMMCERRGPAMVRETLNSFMQNFEDEIREQPPRKKEKTAKAPAAAPAASTPHRAAPTLAEQALRDAASLRNRATSARP